MSSKISARPDYYTASEAMKALHCCHTTLRRYVAEGEIRVRVIHRRLNHYCRADVRRITEQGNWLNAWEARKLLCCSATTLRRYYHAGMVKGKKLNGRRILYRRASVTALLRTP